MESPRPPTNIQPCTIPSRTFAERYTSLLESYPLDCTAQISNTGSSMAFLSSGRFPAIPPHKLGPWEMSRFAWYFSTRPWPRPICMIRKPDDIPLHLTMHLPAQDVYIHKAYAYLYRKHSINIQTGLASPSFLTFPTLVSPPSEPFMRRHLLLMAKQRGASPTAL